MNRNEPSNYVRWRSIAGDWDVEESVADDLYAEAESLTAGLNPRYRAQLDRLYRKLLTRWKRQDRVTRLSRCDVTFIRPPSEKKENS